MANIYLMIIFTGSTFAMQQNPMYKHSSVQNRKVILVKKRAGYTHQTDTEKVSFMGLIKSLLPQSKEQPKVERVPKPLRSVSSVPREHVEDNHEAKMNEYPEDGDEDIRTLKNPKSLDGYWLNEKIEGRA